MWNSKLKNSIIGGVIAVALTGCLRADKQSAADVEALYGLGKTASFQVNNVNFEEGPVTFKTGWSIPVKNEYILMACLTDRITQDRLIGHKFRVETDSLIHKPVADRDGCIKWTEEVPFEFFGEERYLKFSRRIVGDGLHRGAQVIEFAIDPWRKSRESTHAEFVWLNHPDLIATQWMISDSSKVQAAQNAKFKHNLLVDNMTVELTQDKVAGQGIGLQMAMEMDPFVYLRQMTGEQQRHFFRQGKFNVTANIIGVNMGSTQDVNMMMTDIGSLDVKSVAMQDGKLHVTFPKFNLQYKNTNGNLVLALKVSADGISEGVLAPFTVLYRMGDFYEWLGKKTPLRIQDNNTHIKTTYDALLKTVPVNAVQINEARNRAGIKPLEAFQFDYFDIQYNSIKPGETATNRTINYNVRVCVTHPLRGNRKAEGETFLVSTDNRTEFEMVTDDKGCMGWLDEVNHYYYKPERYILNNIKIRHASGFNKSLKIALNPWDLFATFGKDLQKDPQVLKSIVDYEEWEKKYPNIPQKIESRLILADFQYTAIKFDYDIKEDLSLNVKKSVLLQLGPEVQRYSSMTQGRKAVEWLRDGIWLLKVAIHKDYLDPAQKGAVVENTESGPRYSVSGNEKISERHYISYQKKLVRVINGRIITPVTFEMEDLRLMRIRSNMLIQLEPIDETQLLLANWMKEVLDQRAYLDDRQRQDFEKFKEAIAGFISTHFGQDENKVDGDLEKYRYQINPKKMEVSEIYADESLSDDDKRLVGEEELKAKNQYIQDRKAIIDQFLSQIDSVKVREAIHTNDLEKLNDLLHDATRFQSRVAADGTLQTYPKDMIEVLANQGDDSKIPARVIPGSEAKVHFFVQEGNTPIDAGLLLAINDKFSMTEREMSNLRLNDFTVNPAAAFFDIDKIIEPLEVSGLRKRSFLGPVTFLMNGNGSQVRPTDTLDEVFCINNSCTAKDVTEQELREWTYSDSSSFLYKRFYNSVAHFFNKHVDDLIVCKDGGLIESQTFCGSTLPTKEVTVNGKKYFEFIGLDNIASREKKARSLMSNYVRLNGLDYVSLTNQKLQKVASDCPFPYYDESCLVDDNETKVIAAQDLLSGFDQVERSEKQRSWVSQQMAEDDPHLIYLRSGSSLDNDLTLMLPIDLYKHKTTREEVANFVKTGEASEAFEAKLCLYMAESYIRRLLENHVLIKDFVKNLRNELVGKCIGESFSPPRRGPGLIVFDRKLRVEQTKRFLFKGGKSMNVNISSSTGVDQKFSKDRKWSYDFMAIPRIGLSLFQSIPIVGNILNGSGFQISSGHSKGQSSGMSLNSGTYLVMQVATFDIEIQAYEQCLIMKYNSQALGESTNLQAFVNRHAKPLDVAFALNYGLFLCTGEVEQPRDPNDPSKLKPRAVRERYYYFTQHFTEGDMLDSGDLYNHPWLLMLRGRRDFNVFMAGINGFSNDINMYDMSGPIAHVKEYTWPIENLVTTYLDVQPTFPGIYTILDNEPADFPWGNDAPQDAFVAPLSLGIGLGAYQNSVTVDPDADADDESELKQLESNDPKLKGLVEPQGAE
jgi:hypothetical protein